MDAEEKTAVAPGMQQWNKAPRLNRATKSEEAEDNWQQHQRMKQETEAMSGKQGDIL
jgi:hypothetical protein